MSQIRHEPLARTVGWELTAGHTIDRHQHDEHQLVYVSSGVLRTQTAAGSWVVSRDRAVWLPAGTWHEHRFYGPSSFHTVGFPAHDPPWREREPTLVAVSPLLRELLIECARPDLTSAEARRLRAVVGDQLKHSAQQPMALPSPHDPRLANACALAEQRLGEQIGLKDLARTVGASESTLSRLFRHELGMTYPQWRANVRLLNATILLCDGATVTETAQRCGWQTTSSFIDTFRRAMGATPGTYRNSRKRTSVPRP
jgi:AraC-like DNA-binding protein